MNKSELVAAVRDRGGNLLTPEEAVAHVLDVMIRTAASGEHVTITGFGRFELLERAARTGRNPRTGAPVPIPSRPRLSWGPGTNVDRLLAGEDVPDITRRAQEEN